MVWRGMVSTLRADRSRRWDLKEVLALRKGEEGTDADSVGEVGECMSTAVAGGVSSSLWLWAGWLEVWSGSSWEAYSLRMEVPKVFVRVLDRERDGTGEGCGSEARGVFMLVACCSGAQAGLEEDRDRESDIMEMKSRR